MSGTAAIDDPGRITDHVVLRALRWELGTSVDVEVIGGVAAGRSAGSGSCSV